MMEPSAHVHDTDPYQLDPLAYLSEVPEPDPEDGITLFAGVRRERYQAVRLALLRVQSEDPATFDLALQEIHRKLGIKAKTVKEDLAALTTPPVSKGAMELLGQMGQTHQLRLAQDFVENKLWFGVIAGEDKLLLNSNRELLTLDKVPEGLAVKDSGFDLCRLSKEAIVHYLSGGTAAGAELLTDLRNFFTRFAVF